MSMARASRPHPPGASPEPDDAACRAIANAASGTPPRADTPEPGSGAATAPAGAAPAAPAPPAGDGDGDRAAAARELTVLTFAGEHTAEHAFGDVHGRAPDAPWARDVAFVECHHHGRIVERAALLDTVRAALPERTSGIVALATPPEADAMIAAFDDRATRVSRHRLTSDEAAAVEAAIVPAPPAASGPQASSSIS
jgi:hypothetical protein